MHCSVFKETVRKTNKQTEKRIPQKNQQQQQDEQREKISTGRMNYMRREITRQSIIKRGEQDSSHFYVQVGVAKISVLLLCTTKNNEIISF